MSTPNMITRPYDRPDPDEWDEYVRDKLLQIGPPLEAHFKQTNKPITFPVGSTGILAFSLTRAFAEAFPWLNVLPGKGEIRFERKVPKPVMDMLELSKYSS